jgi:thiol-disulfide isomerase/thioredoxin
MVMKKALPLVLVLMFLVSTGSAVLGKVQLYVHHKKVKANLIAKGEQFYGPVKVIEETLRCTIKVDPATLAITVNGTAIEGKAFVQDGETYVPIKTIAKKLGFNYSYNKSTEMLDINRLTAGPVTESSAGKEPGTQPGVNPGKPADNPGGKEYENFQPPPDSGSLPGNQQPPAGAAINWFADLSAALNASKTDRNKPVLVNFYVLDDACRQLYENLESEAVKPILFNVICVALDGQKEEALARKYSVNTFPAVLILDSGGKEHARFEGVKTPEEIVQFLNTKVRR